MSKSKRRILLIGIILLIIVSLVLFLVFRTKSGSGINIKNNIQEIEQKEEFVKVLKDGTKMNNSRAFSKAKKIENYEVSDMQLSYREGSTVLIATVKNVSESSTELTNVIINLLDKNGNSIVEIPGIISPLEEGETTQLNCGITSDYVNAYDFNIVLK